MIYYIFSFSWYLSEIDCQSDGIESVSFLFCNSALIISSSKCFKASASSAICLSLFNLFIFFSIYLISRCITRTSAWILEYESVALSTTACEAFTSSKLWYQAKISDQCQYSTRLRWKYIKAVGLFLSEVLTLYLTRPLYDWSLSEITDSSLPCPQYVYSDLILENGNHL